MTDLNINSGFTLQFNKLPRDKDHPFVMIPNSIFKDSRLSYKEIGLLVYLSSLPPGWNTSIKQLIKIFTDGEKSVRSSVNHLIKLGYLKKKQGRLQSGKFGRGTMTVFECPNQPTMKMKEDKVMTEELTAVRHFSPCAPKRHAVKETYINNNNNNIIYTNNNKDVVIPKQPVIAPKEADDVVVMLENELKEIGVNLTAAKSISLSYPSDRIRKAIDYVKKKPGNISNMAGYIRKALEQNWNLEEKPKKEISQTQFKSYGTSCNVPDHQETLDRINKWEEDYNKAQAPESRAAGEYAISVLKSKILPPRLNDLGCTAPNLPPMDLNCTLGNQLRISSMEVN